MRELILLEKIILIFLYQIQVKVGFVERLFNDKDTLLRFLPTVRFET